MKHVATPRFWRDYNRLPKEVRTLADKNHALLKANPSHPSLQLKKIGDLWTARVGLHYRVLGADEGDTIVWYWIGSHAEYDKLLS